MSITSIFTQSKPQIQGFTFDALLQESTELRTNTTQYPIETGSYGSDNAVNMPLRLTMIVALSDNPFKVTIAENSQNDLLDTAIGTVSGTALSVLPDALTEALGIGARVVNSTIYQNASTRSANALETIRQIQRNREFITVIGAKRTYYPVLITATHQTTDIQNEQGLVLQVEMEEYQFVDGIVTANNSVPNEFKIGQAQTRQNGGSRSVTND